MQNYMIACVIATTEDEEIESFQMQLPEDPRTQNGLRALPELIEDDLRQQGFDAEIRKIQIIAITPLSD